MHAVLSAGQKVWPFFSFIKQIILALSRKINLTILEVPLWQLNVWRAQHRIILRLNLVNDLTSVSWRKTRNSQSLHIPLFKSTSDQRSLYYRTVKIWNLLDNELKLSKDVLTYKRKLKSKLYTLPAHWTL